MAHCTSNPMGKAAIVHTNYPIKTEKLFCGADKGAWNLGEGEKWAGERGGFRKMAILKVEKWAQKPPGLLRYLQGVVQEPLLMAAPETCTFDPMPTSATTVPIIRIFGSLKLVWILHSDQSEWNSWVPILSDFHPPDLCSFPQKLPEHLLPLHTSMSLKAPQRSSEHGKTPCHKS